MDTNQVFIHKKMEYRVNKLYENCFRISKYGTVQFLIRTDTTLKAIKLAKSRLNKISLNVDRYKDIFEVSGIILNEDGLSFKAFTPSFMENTHLHNQFTADSFKTVKGDLLKYDNDGDGYGFWYKVDKNGNRLSQRLKGSIFIGLISEGVIKKFNI